jgi:hypothetical protein
MPLIDEEGNFLGIINIIDFFAVLLVLSVTVSGIALVDPFSSGQSVPEPQPERDTRYATVELGTQPAYIIDVIDAGDQIRSDLTVADVYTTAGTENSQIATIVGQHENITLSRTGVDTGAESNGDVTLVVQMNGTLAGNGEFRYNNRPVRRGEDILFRTSEYNVTGTVTQLTDERTGVDTQNTTVIAETTAPRSVIGEIAVGDEYTIAGTTIGTVESRRVYPSGDDEHARVELTLSLRTRMQDGHLRFANTRLTVGRTIPFAGDGYSITPTVRSRGTDTQRESENRTIRVRLSNVSPETADAIDVGLVEQIGNRETARITAVETEPAAVTVESDGGQLYQREHPRNKDVTLSVRARVQNTTTGYRFRGRSVRVGSQITLSFRTITVHGKVIQIP